MTKRPSPKNIVALLVVLVPWLAPAVRYEAMDLLPLLVSLSIVCGIIVLTGVNLDWPPRVTAGGVLVANTMIVTFVMIVTYGQEWWGGLVVAVSFCLPSAVAVFAILRQSRDDGRSALLRAAKLGVLSFVLLPYAMATRAMADILVVVLILIAGSI